MTKTHVVRIPMLPFGMLNAFLLVRAGKAILVDTGLPGSEAKIEAALGRCGLSWHDLRLIVLTHAHIDHAGSAARVRGRSSIPVLAHRDEVAYCQGRPPLLTPSGVFGRLFLATGAIQQPFEYFTPDMILSEDEFDLSEYGFPARVLFTPGHTPGSLSVLLDDGRVVAGDLAASGILLGGIAFRNRPKSPPFEENTAAVATSLQHLLALGGNTFLLGHGGPLQAEAIRKHIVSLIG